MTIHRIQYIDCDVQDCGSRYQAASPAMTAAEARQAAKAKGWTSEQRMANAVAVLPRVDICPLDHDA